MGQTAHYLITYYLHYHIYEFFMFQICFYVPATHAEEVKNALFRAGAGKIGNYSHCAWQVLGEGQFLPLSGSKAFIGSEDSLEKVPEYKVEVI